MKLSIETYVLREAFGDEKAIEIIADAGFDCVDYSFYWVRNSRDMLDGGYADYARSLRALLDARGLRCNQAHAPFDLGPGDALDVSNEKYLRLVRSIESAAILGADNIVVHRVAAPEGVDMEEYNRGFYRGFAPYCGKYGIHIAVENLFEHDRKLGGFAGVFGKPEALCAFIRSLDSPWFTACVDVGHAAITGTEPEDYLAGMDGGLLRALHIQDTDYLDDRHQLPYMGKLRWDKIMKALSALGYKGDLTLEVFGYQKRFPRELLPSAVRFAAEVGRRLLAI